MLEVKPKDCPVAARILAAINYRKHRACIKVRETVKISGTYWDGGSRSEYTAVQISSGQSITGMRFDPPQFGGPSSDPVVPIPDGVAVVEHGTCCGKAATAYIYMNAATFASHFPVLQS